MLVFEEKRLKKSVKWIGYLLFGAMAQNGLALEADAPMVCNQCDGWNQPHEPFRIFGNTYYVGVKGLSSVLIASDKGLILIDGGLAQSAPLIDANIRKLGFRTEDIRLIVNSHTHFDHAGGLAALQRASGAVVAASPRSFKALAEGRPDRADPQFGYAPDNYFPAVKNLREIKNGETLRVGELAITALFTPGHTPGGTSWTWRSCEAQRCLDLVYADSLNAIAGPGYRYMDHPDMVKALRGSIATLAALPCDVLLTAHPDVSQMDERLRQHAGAKSNPLVDAGACRRYAAAVSAKLDKKLAEENVASAAR